MSLPTAFACSALLAAASCGHVGLDLLDDDVQLGDGGYVESADGVDGVDASAAGPVEFDGAIAQEEREAGEPARDAGGPDRSDDRDAGACPDGGCGAWCEAPGAFAVRLTIPVRWEHFVLVPGQGRVHVWLKLQGESTGDFDGTLTPCGVALPEMTLQPRIADERHTLAFAGALFDDTGTRLPRAALRIARGRGDAGFGAGPVALLLGARLAAPLTDPWPSSPASVRAADDDGDGRPGISAAYLQGNGQFFPAIEGFRTRRADRADVALRLVTEFQADSASCTEASGTADVRAFDTHILACEVAGTDRACSVEERDFLDSYRQVFALGAGSFAARKLPGDASCADVRRALPVED